MSDLDVAGEVEEQRDPGRLARLFERLNAGLRERMGPAAVVLPTLVFVLAWMYLNAFVGSTWPFGESGFPGYLLPSPEATIALGLVCAVVWMNRKPHGILLVALAAALLVARLLHTADVLVLEVFDRHFDASRDMGLVWELFILLDDAIDRVTLIGYMALSALVIGFLVFLVRQALLVGRNYFVVSVHRWGFLAVAGLAALLSLATGGGPYQPSPVATAIDAADEAPGEEEVAAAVEETRSRLRAAPHGLERLEGHDVYVVHLGSYGRVLLEEPDYRSRIQPVWEQTESALGEDGWQVRSTLLESPARRGLPWLAQATVQTGVPVHGQAGFDELMAADPATLAGFFRDAGHRTVRALPGVSRERPEREMPGFPSRYRAWELGYLGRPYGHIPVPDQLALWRVWERDVEPADQGVFVDVVMSSVQPPYDQHPPYVEAWSTLETGEIYRDLEPVRFETEWTRLDEAAEAWISAHSHQLQVIRGYLVSVVPDPRPQRRRRRRRRAAPDPSPLVLLVGSHQPPGPLARDAETDAVIAHVISRDPELLAPFEERGWTEGMVPAEQPPPYDGLETLLPTMLESFSEAPEPEPPAE